MSLTIKARVIWGFSTLVAILAGVGSFAVYNFRSAQADVAVVEQDVPDMLRIVQIRDNLRHSFALLLSSAVTSDPKSLASFAEETKTIAEQQGKLLDEQKAVLVGSEEIAIFDDILAARNDYSEARVALANFMAAGKREEGAAVVTDRLMPIVARYTEAVQKLINIHRDEVNASIASIDHTASRGNTASIAGVVGGVLIAGVIGFFVVRSTNKALTYIAQMLSTNSSQVACASGQVSASSQSLAQGASEQAASLEESSSALEEMSSMIKKNADTSSQAASFSDEAKDSAGRGSDAMNKMSVAIADIERSSQETAKIIKVIDEIAFQTNLLALNAAVEAARAGEAGKGFAVVAEEVRNLAMRSAEAAKNTSSLIEESVGKAKNGVTIAASVASNLTQINESTVKVSGLIAEIAAASKEQATGIDQITQAVGQMDKVTQTNAANAEETAAASEELSAQAEQMRGCVRELQKLVGLVITESNASESVAVSKNASKRFAPRSAPRATPARQLIPLENAEPPSANFGDFSKAA
jgi:methyl-accepting chemotaxis protein